MATFFLDIVSEELPAHLQDWALREFQTYLTTVLKEARLYPPGEREPQLEVFVTPRRLAALIKNLSPPLATMKKGPWADAEEKIIQGFLRANGLKGVNDCQLIEERGRKRLAIAAPRPDLANVLWGKVVRRISVCTGMEEADKFEWPGETWSKRISWDGGPWSGFKWPEMIDHRRSIRWRFPPDDVLSGMRKRLEDEVDLTRGLSKYWDFSMHRWVRPIIGICAVLDKKPIGDESLEHTRRADTYAHPILYRKEEIKITDANKAVEILDKAKVILRTDKRRKMIAKVINKNTHELTLDEESFISRGASRSEYPHVCEEELHRSYMEDLPLPLVKSVVRAHECLLADEHSGKFFIVSDSKPNARISAGFKNVIEAKLNDARYFLRHDQQRRLEEFLPLLKNITYHEELGSVWHRAKRLEKLSRFVASKLAATNGEAQELAAEAGLLAKADLATDIVREFPNLQGVMGGYYLSKQRPNDIVSAAISNHYKSLVTLPSGMEYRLSFLQHDTRLITDLALVVAERADHLTGLWLCGERPTSSRDPLGMSASATLLYISSRFTRHDGKKLPGLFVTAKDDERLSNLSIITKDGRKLHGERLPSLPGSVLQEALELNYEDWKAVNGGENPKDKYRIIREMCEFILRRGKLHITLDVTPAAGELSRLIEAVEGVVSPDDFTALDFRYCRLQDFFGRERAKLDEIVEDATRVENILRPHLKAEKSPKFDEQKLQQPEEKKLYEIYKKVDDNIASQIKGSSVDFDFGIFTELHAPLADFFDQVTVNCDDKALRDNRLALLLKVRACYRRFADFTKLRTG